MEQNKKIQDKYEEKKITSKEEDFSEWYQDIIAVADLAEHGPAKGTMIMKPYGYALWENIQKELDSKIKEKGVENVYFPLLIPEQLLKKEESHIEGFSPEVAVVTYAGGKKLQDALVIRPTSETIIYDSFSRWISSHRDLPLLVNQWANVVRWEVRPRLFLRTTEFLWQEGHTAHRSIEEADTFAKTMLEVYKNVAEQFLAVSVIPGEKTENEKFAGAHTTYTLEAMMQDGKALQFATSHNLGTNFSKAFNISFTDLDGSSSFCAQTSWGFSTRTIGGIIMTHSDNKGLKLPPKVAPVQIVIIPIWPKEEVKNEVNHFVENLNNKLKNFRTKIDYSEARAGDKFYKWEKKGVPIRMEVGPKDIKANSVILVRRDTGEKITVKLDQLNDAIGKLLEAIQNNMFQEAKTNREENTIIVDTWDEFKEGISNKKFVMAHWSENKEVEKKIKEETGATIRCIPFDTKPEKGKCVYSGKPSKRRVLFAKAY